MTPNSREEKEEEEERGGNNKNLDCFQKKRKNPAHLLETFFFLPEDFPHYRQASSSSDTAPIQMDDCQPVTQNLAENLMSL